MTRLRLEPEPLTAEDREIWAQICVRAVKLGYVPVSAWSACRSSDRRDADLILHAQAHEAVAAFLRMQDYTRIDVRQGCGINILHLGIGLPRL